MQALDIQSLTQALKCKLAMCSYSLTCFYQTKFFTMPNSSRSLKYMCILTSQHLRVRGYLIISIFFPTLHCLHYHLTTMHIDNPYSYVIACKCNMCATSTSITKTLECGQDQVTCEFPFFMGCISLLHLSKLFFYSTKVFKLPSNPQDQIVSCEKVERAFT